MDIFIRKIKKYQPVKFQSKYKNAMCLQPYIGDKIYFLTKENSNQRYNAKKKKKKKKKKKDQQLYPIKELIKE
jgi:hypothetical protein